MGRHSFNASEPLALVLMLIVVSLCTCCVRANYHHSRSLSKATSRFLDHRTMTEFRYDRPKNGAFGIKLTTLTYDDTFAYGCLHEIPIPNTTLDTTFTPQEEKAVLMEIFNQTGGYNWFTSSNWGNHSVPHCLWYGVTCENTSRYVISITLHNNNLVGTLPRSLWKFRNLQGLCIFANEGLEGSLGDIISANMTTLLRLELAFNKLSGPIPGEILPQMKSLVKIQLCCQSGGRFSGQIPKDIGNLTELEVLSLGENELHGTIPKSIGNLKKLWFLDFGATKNLQGGFENLFNLSSLRFMHLSLAGLNGTLPDEFGLYFPAMKECLLPGNNFGGQIPSTIGNMTNLWHLNLANNNFTGKIPRSIGSIPCLKIIDLRQNRLNLLEEGLQFKSRCLEVLILAGNKDLTMSFEYFLESIALINQSLRILNIRACHFYGTIPLKLWNFQSLISVDVSHNFLSGRLPSPRDNVLVLLDLDVSVNNLSGQIPQEFARLLALEILDVSENPYMQKMAGSEPLPSYMTVDYKTLKRRNQLDNFKCPNARLSYNNGLVILDPRYYDYLLCICDIGFYGFGKTCLPCMKGAVCKDHMRPVRNMMINAGYWPSSRDQNVTHMVKCSHVLGTSSLVNTSCNPRGTCFCGLQWLVDGNSANSRPSTVCKKSCLCHKGSKDRFCSKCEEGFYKQGILCYPCPKTELSVYILVVLVVLTMVLLILAFAVFYEKKRFLSVVFAFVQIILVAVFSMLRIIPGWLLELNVVALIVGLAGRGKHTRGILKISVFYFQTLDALISNTNEIWPLELLESQRYIGNVFNFQFSGLACTFPSLFTPLGGLVSLILLPIVCIMGILLYYALGYALLTIRGLPVRRSQLRNSCLQLSIMLLNLTYFPIVKKTAAALAHCGKDGSYRYLLEAPWMECSGHTYTLLQVFGWLALVMYVLGIPFGVFFPLLRKKVAKRDQLAPQDKKSLDSWLGSIYLPYKEAFRSYFEILVLLRRMLIAFSLSLIPRLSSFQTIAVCLVHLASLCFQLHSRPFRDSYEKISLENSAETMVLLTLHFSFMNVRYAFLTPHASAPIVWLLVAVNAIVICSLVVCIILLLARAHILPAAPQTPTQHDPEDAPDRLQSTYENKFLSPLISGRKGNQYGTLDDA
ncbi:PREDICTED: putative leucine-rich repeat-containing protein DDB_G0281931 [Acropora digitifera]|uniref:putative leucine-rich repeat-containing protein DDB_G0281931 n=1 Tax=Acropora digitifera TaxID=70779 RepID=UPI00077A2A2D|nr:PREDICTED: putative leucine-rich repeat-containing protein DDB_G0281931 [Acropora digitifera]